MDEAVFTGAFLDLEVKVDHTPDVNPFPYRLSTGRRKKEVFMESIQTPEAVFASGAILSRDESRELAGRLYRDGVPVKKIARKFKVSFSSISRWVQTEIANKKAEQNEKIKSLLKSGASIEEIARTIGVSDNTVRRRMGILSREREKDLSLSGEKLEALRLRLSGRSMDEVASVLGKTTSETWGLMAEPDVVQEAARLMGKSPHRAFKALITSRPLASTAPRLSRSSRLIAGNDSGVEKVMDLSYRREKFAVRSMILKAVAGELGRKDVSAFTLPGTEWLFERDLCLQQLTGGKKTHITAVERDEAVFSLSRLNMAGIPAGPAVKIDFRQADAGAFMETLPEKPVFNLIWSDFMGQLCRSAVAFYRGAFRRMKPGLFFTTHMMGREREDEQAFIREMARVCNVPAAMGREAAIPMLLLGLAREAGLKGSLLVSHPYKGDGEEGNGKAASMLLVGIRVQKS